MKGDCILINCIIGENIVNTLNYSEKELREWSKAKVLKCPACNETVIFKNGRIKIAHFAHEKDSECKNTYYESESKEHLQGKLYLYNFLKDLQGINNLQLEKWMPETKQRPDLYFEFDNNKYVIEYQCSPITIGQLRERKLLYRSNKIIDIWIFGTEKYDKDKEIACQDYLKNYLTLNPFNEKFIFKKKNYIWDGRKVDNFNKIIQVYKDSYYNTEKYISKANKTNEISNYLHDLLKLDKFDNITLIISKLLDNCNEFRIKLDFIEHNKQVMNLNDYFNYIYSTGKNDRYLNILESYKIPKDLFRFINTRGKQLN